MQNKKHIVIGMSGGVDSAVAAWLLKKKGHKVTGVFMKNWDDDDTDTYCTSRQDFLDAAATADILNIPLEAVSFSKEYKEKVFNDFLHEYSNGRTPNPDVFCNSEIKFKAFLNHSFKMGADLMATGHYAQIKRITEGKYNLLRALDKTKDQSYFLHRLTQEQLSFSTFPLGGYLKVDVRKIAKELKLPNAKKPDSTGICFIGERPFQEFLSKYIKNKPGLICDSLGNVIGEHNGLHLFTIGQRKGLGIGGINTKLKKNLSQSISDHEPWFVAGKDYKKNKLIVVQGRNNPKLMTKLLTAKNLHWILNEPPHSGSKLQVKIRYSQNTTVGIINFNKGILKINFLEPQRAVTPGQSVVVYEESKCLGGGIIFDSN